MAETSVTDADSAVAQGVGGLLLFGGKAPANLGSQLAAVEAKARGGHGLLVMTDEEGGEIQRMANLVGSLPWPAYMGSHWTSAQVQAAVTAVGKKMRAAHVQADLAPVLDVDGRNVDPSATDPEGRRSFGGSTTLVSRDGVAYMRGLLAAGEIPVVKHFPGLGGASGNTDDGPAHTLPWKTLQRVALPPFVAAIRGGAPAVMISNAVVPGLSKFPASLSPAVIARELVAHLGFHGLVMTDSLSANAITAAGFNLETGAVQALKSGADMVLFGLASTPAATRAEASQMAVAIAGAVSDGQLLKPRLVSAAGAVLAVRHVSLCKP